jgi:hypothetical protein
MSAGKVIAVGLVMVAAGAGAYYWWKKKHPSTVVPGTTNPGTTNVATQNPANTTPAVRTGNIPIPVPNIPPSPPAGGLPLSVIGTTDDLEHKYAVGRDKVLGNLNPVDIDNWCYTATNLRLRGLEVINYKMGVASPLWNAQGRGMDIITYMNGLQTNWCGGPV